MVWQEIVNLPTSVTIGSIPIISTNVLVCSYRGYYCGLSIHLRGFDSPTDRQVYVGVRRTARQRIANPHNAGSNPVTHSMLNIKRVTSEVRLLGS